MVSTANETFAGSTSLKAQSSHTYEADFRDSWCIGTVPHGGYVTSCFLQVASKHFNTTLSKQNQPHSIALHIDFLRRTEAGPALFTVKDTKLGRQASVIHVTLTQSGREEALAVITNSNMTTEEGVSFSTSYKMTPQPVPVSLERLSKDEDEKWCLQSRMPSIKFRKAMAKLEFYYPRNGQVSNSCADEWVRLSTGEKWTNASLGFLSDAWPMPVETNLREQASRDPNHDSNKAIMWYPTLLLNIDFKKALPEEGVKWLFARTESKQIKNGRFDIEVVILDDTGDIVALSHHVALAVPAERNVAKRVTGSKM